MHLADAFIQSDLHCIQVTVFLHLTSSCIPWELSTQNKPEMFYELISIAEGAQYGLPG